MNNDKDKIREEIYLGALLHDIGKFYQRASGDFDSNDSNLSEDTKKLANYICPINQNGYYGYQHVLWTAQFFKNNKENFNKILNTSENKIDNFINFSIYHHKPASLNQAIVQLADWWASGIDRSQSEEYSNHFINWGKEKYKKVPLSAIFQNLYVNNKRPNRENEWYFNLKTLEINKETIFPNALKENQLTSHQEKYNTIWKQFNTEFQNLPTGNFKVFIESLYFLLKKYTWCIPASTKDYPDSSLFEHSKMVAAFADCLFRFYVENSDAFNYDNSRFRIKLKNEKEHKYYPVILLCVDLSGIQNFIYNISSKRAAKSLRGRSFYLQILVETITNQLLEKTDTFRSNVIYSSGGKMFMLLPNTQNIRETISNYRENLENWIWKEFNGDIYISLDYVAFAYDMDHRDEKGQNLLIEGKNNYYYLGDLWKEVVDKTAKCKNRKFKSIIKNDTSFFDPFGQGGDIDICAITGIESNNLKNLEKNNYEEEIKILPIVKTQIEIGENLVNHKYLLYSKQKQPDNIFKSSKYSFEIFNSYWYIFDNNGYNNVTSIDDGIIYYENNFDFLSNTKGEKSSNAYRFYGGNRVPEINERMKTFEELVDKEAAFKRLAILRMDVDNLSQIFINGFKQKDDKGNIIKDGSNFSRLSTLSFQLDLFFSGYINKIHENYRDKIIIVYSGGDDLFAVGDWQAIINFAEDVRNEFRNYVCNREDISLSGGIVLVDKKFPISKAAEWADEAEKKAKKFGEIKKYDEANCKVYEEVEAIKNAVNLFGENINWHKEFDGVKAMKDFLYDTLKNQKLSKGLLQKIFIFRNMKKSNNLGWHWVSAYTFARHKNEKNKDCIEKLKNYFITGAINLNNKDYKFGDRAIDILAIAARWAELKLRSEKNAE
ncbi:MAG: type III-A CRISPR-associated protein Cas10/Csm1 [Bacteroidales bacterium]|nr:type III-A CRISPR-associated protein Cas10/Csm1 [Bacteroidales bacterium]